MSYNVTNTTSPTLSPTYNDEPDEVVVRDFLGIFMLIMTLFVFVFAIWTYRVHLKRLFTKCWHGVSDNACIQKCVSCLKRRQGNDNNNRNESSSTTTTSEDLLSNIIFDPEEEQKSELTRSLLSK